MQFKLVAIGLALSASLTSACVSPDSAEEEVEVRAIPKIMLNKIMLNKIMLNGLLGIPEVLIKLKSVPLNTSSFKSGVLSDVLDDEDTREVMAYLVSCALSDSSPPVTWDDPVSAKHYSWSGSAGLCPGWATKAPSVKCQELVSACLLARENVEGISVATSQRGQHVDGTAFVTGKRVQAKPVDADGSAIASLNTCWIRRRGALRNCGWSPERSLVGRCTPGESITMSCSNPARRRAVRICEGVAACNRTDALKAGQACGKSDGLEFVCPASGTYAAMLAPWYSNQKLEITPMQASSGEYAATERQVFGEREAHFFGNLFDETALNPDVAHVSFGTAGNLVKVFTNTPGAVFRDAWVCADAKWETPDAYLHHRLCATFDSVSGDPIEKCVATSLQRCNATLTDSPLNRCSHVDGGPLQGDGDFDDCTDGFDVKRKNGITVFLNDPCDLVPPALARICRRRP